MPHYLFDLNGRAFNFAKEVNDDNNSPDFDARAFYKEGHHFDNGNTTVVIYAKTCDAAKGELIKQDYTEQK